MANSKSNLLNSKKISKSIQIIKKAQRNLNEGALYMVEKQLFEC